LEMGLLIGFNVPTFEHKSQIWVTAIIF